jgi:hypothetical protein
MRHTQTCTVHEPHTDLYCTWATQTCTVHEVYRSYLHILKLTDLYFVCWSLNGARPAGYIAVWSIVRVYVLYLHKHRPPTSLECTNWPHKTYSSTPSLSSTPKRTRILACLNTVSASFPLLVQSVMLSNAPDIVGVCVVVVAKRGCFLECQLG